MLAEVVFTICIALPKPPFTIACILEAVVGEKLRMLLVEEQGPVPRQRKRRSIEVDHEAVGLCDSNGVRTGDTG